MVTGLVWSLCNRRERQSPFLNIFSPRGFPPALSEIKTIKQKISHIFGLLNKRSGFVFIRLFSYPKPRLSVHVLANARPPGEFQTYLHFQLLFALEQGPSILSMPGQNRFQEPLQDIRADILQLSAPDSDHPNWWWIHTTHVAQIPPHSTLVGWFMGGAAGRRIFASVAFSTRIVRPLLA